MVIIGACQALLEYIWQSVQDHVTVTGQAQTRSRPSSPAANAESLLPTRANSQPSVQRERSGQGPANTHIVGRRTPYPNRALTTSGRQQPLSVGLGHSGRCRTLSL